MSLPDLLPGKLATTFVTEQGVAGKYGRNRQHHTKRSIDALAPLERGGKAGLFGGKAK